MDSNKRAWHLERTVSLGHIITTLTVAVTAVAGWKDMDKRVALIELATVQQRETDRQQDTHSKEALDALRSDLRDISIKLDRLIERTK